MSIKQLNEEQVRTWTLEQKDRWWLENVFRGDMPQLTLRSAVTGFLLGGVLSATALYIAGIPDGICAHSRELLDRHAVRWLGIEPAGHWVHADQLDAFATGVVGFLREV